ncbi:MAG: LysR family transcriptional regulator [Burkholderiales bacterium]|nr:LysR family transcriptional regulator [Burkholderiales bacterium]
MTLRQLRYLREIARQSLNISAAALALHTSQPGVSRQLQLLERELGIQLLLRRRNRVHGFTPAGRAVLEVAERLLKEADNIRLIAEDMREESRGRLALATSHLHARYTLPPALKAFTHRYPQVRLHVLQADPDDIPQLIESGAADIGVSTEFSLGHPGIAQLPSETICRSLIVPCGHPLSRRRRVSLRDIAAYPLVGYHQRSRGGQIVARTFRDHGIEVDFVVNAADTDVIKAYVAEGLGIAVVPSIALVPGSDTTLCALDVTRLFPRSQMTISLRRDTYLRRYLTDFIGMIVPGIERDSIDHALQR